MVHVHVSRVRETRFASRTRLVWVVVVPGSHHYLTSIGHCTEKAWEPKMESTINMSYDSTTEQVMSAIDLNDLRGPSSANPSVLAYLGPAGTYSHQVYLILMFTGNVLKPSLPGRAR